MRILNIHALTSESRMTNIQHSLALYRHLPKNLVENLNILLPQESQNTEFDLICINYEVLSYRSSKYWGIIRSRLKPYLQMSKNIILIVQDDYTYSSRLNRFIKNNDIEIVYSSLTSGLSKIYRSLDKGKLSVRYMPTGLMEHRDLNLFNMSKTDLTSRSLKIFASASKLPLYFGEKGVEKFRIISEIKEILGEDIVTANLTFGIKWLENLGRNRFTLFSKGGASLVDRRGNLRKIYLILHRFPKINEFIFGCIEKSKICTGDFTASGPRLIEAILMESVLLAPDDTYELAIRPYVHFIPIQVESLVKEGYLEFLSDNSEADKYTSAAFNLLRDSVEFHYCYQVSDLVRCSIGLIESDSTHSHDVDDVNLALRELSRDNCGDISPYDLKRISSELQKKGLDILNLRISNLKGKEKFALDLLIASKLEFDIKDLGLLTLIKGNGIPLNI